MTNVKVVQPTNQQTNRAKKCPRYRYRGHKKKHKKQKKKKHKKKQQKNSTAVVNEVTGICDRP